MAPFLDRSIVEDHTYKNNRPLAWARGINEPPLLDETFGTRVQQTVKRFPNCIAVKDNKQNLTYAELDKRSDALALALRQLGVARGDRVVTSLGRTISCVVVTYACFKLGAILAPMNPSYSPQQVVSAIEHVTAKCYILSTHLTLPNGEIRATEALWETALMSCYDDNPPHYGGLACLRSVILINDSPTGFIHDFEHPAVWDLGALLEAQIGEPLTEVENVKPDDVVNLLFTSGTTSLPKAVMITHWGLINNGRVIGSEEYWNLGPQDIVPCSLPLYHAGGLIPVVITSMIYGACISFPCESFHAATCLREIMQDRSTIITGVPTMFQAWLDLLSEPEFANHDFSHVKAGFVTAAPISPSLRSRIDQRIHGSNIFSGYGMTETTCFMTLARSDDPEHKKRSTLGRPIPHRQIRITARDDPHCVLGVGERGEIQAAGMGVTKGYWNNPIKTAEAIIEEPTSEGTIRWMRTGDEGTLDEDGYLTITSRIKDIIIRGGENIHPPLVENALMECPGVKIAAAIGLPDENLGEIVAAFVVPQDSAVCFGGFEVDEDVIDLRPKLKSHSAISSPSHPDTEDDSDSPFADSVSNGSSSGCSSRTGSVLSSPACSSTKSLDCHAGSMACKTAISAGLLREWTRTRLSRHLIPKVFFWVSELPTTPTGKVEKYKLRELGRSVTKR